MGKLLQVSNLSTTFFSHLGPVQAVRGISFDLEEGEILGIVGESGSGKSVTSLSIIGLIDDPGKITSGSIIFDGRELTKLSYDEMSDIRGKEISMIFQDPMTSLNPVFSVGNQLVEVIRRHTPISKEQAIIKATKFFRLFGNKYSDQSNPQFAKKLEYILKHDKIDRSEAKKRAIQLLKQVNIPDPEKRIKAYPHQFSGGMRQRVMIAMAMSNNPKLLIADEPTTALDVTIQAQILDIMRNIIKDLHSSVILITHDLGVIAEICDKVAVMYGGMIMEKASVYDIFETPQHPYTKGLLLSVPRHVKGEKRRLIPIDGTPPDLLNPPKGCPFAPRCPHAMEICLNQPSPLFKTSSSQEAACWLHHPDAPSIEGFVKAEVPTNE